MSKKNKTINSEMKRASDVFGSEKFYKSMIKVDITPKTEKQKEYWKALKDISKHIVIGSGSAGTGKSYLSTAYSLLALKEGIFNEVKILVPTCEASSKLSIGLLPGTIEEKTRPWRECTNYTMKKIMEKSDVFDTSGLLAMLEAKNKITFELISYIRGKTFDNTLLLIEEAENLSPEELLLIITRIGENSKLIISGDPRQADRKYPNNKSGLEHALTKLNGMEEVSIVNFTDEDVVRNTLITKILKNW